jgi:hypothetical protein
MKPFSLSFLAALVIGALLAGCVTPATRIGANPEIFARLTPEQQALVRAGQVAPGFSMDAVRLAVGTPDRVSSRIGPGGETTIWHYSAYEAKGRRLFTGFYHADRRWGGWGWTYYLDYPDRRVSDRFVVLFRDGLVVGVTRGDP